MMSKKKMLFIGIIIILLSLVFVKVFYLKGVKRSGQITKEAATVAQAKIDYYTCGMHPSVKVSVEDYKKGTVDCPICNMDLIPVYTEKDVAENIYYGCGVDTEGKCPHCDLGQPDTKCICGQHSFVIKGEKIDCPICGSELRPLTLTEVDKLKGVISRVSIKGDQARLAGVKTETVRRMSLHKEIRTVGQVAYDPDLAIAEEEFVSALKALDKIKEGTIPEIKDRTENLVNSSRRKLRLLGLSNELIDDLARTREVHTSYILPEEKMWVYGDVYEYEMGWVRIGEKVKVTTSSLPGEEFPGVISSINPVLNPKTRSLSFRVEVENPDLKLRPEMYVDVTVMSSYTSPTGESSVLAIPKSSVLDTGIRRIVWVYAGENKYEGRIVEIGPEVNATVGGKEKIFYPVLKGVREGELVVTEANFLIDSQSQISGVAAAAYSGAIGAEEDKRYKGAPGHQH